MYYTLKQNSVLCLVKFKKIKLTYNLLYIACDCDPSGSLDDGICDSKTDLANGLESGRCHCKINVEGRRCDSCKNGFWSFSESNPDGCQGTDIDVFCKNV